MKRLPELLELERRGLLSCRHRDILRCSKSRHFRSCYALDGINSHIPREIVNRCSNIAIIGKKDKSGDWIARAFVKFQDKHLFIARVYGNGMENLNNEIRKLELKSGYRVLRHEGDFSYL